MKLPIDILAGTDRLRKATEARKDLDEMEKWWKEEAKAIEKIRKKHPLYCHLPVYLSAKFTHGMVIRADVKIEIARRK